MLRSRNAEDRAANKVVIQRVFQPVGGWLIGAGKRDLGVNHDPLGRQTFVVIGANPALAGKSFKQKAAAYHVLCLAPACLKGGDDPVGDDAACPYHIMCATFAEQPVAGQKNPLQAGRARAKDIRV